MCKEDDEMCRVRADAVEGVGPVQDEASRLRQRIANLVGGTLLDGKIILVGKPDGRRIVVSHQNDRTELAICTGKHVYSAVARIVIDTNPINPSLLNYSVTLSFVPPEEWWAKGLLLTQHAVSLKRGSQNFCETYTPEGVASAEARQQLVDEGMPRLSKQSMKLADYQQTVDALFAMVERYMADPQSFLEGPIPSPIRFTDPSAPADAA